jgi:hypothetical protein
MPDQPEFEPPCIILSAAMLVVVDFAGRTGLVYGVLRDLAKRPHTGEEPANSTTTCTGAVAGLKRWETWCPALRSYYPKIEYWPKVGERVKEVADIAKADFTGRDTNFKNDWADRIKASAGRVVKLFGYPIFLHLSPDRKNTEPGWRAKYFCDLLWQLRTDPDGLLPEFAALMRRLADDVELATDVLALDEGEPVRPAAKRAGRTRKKAQPEKIDPGHHAKSPPKQIGKQPPPRSIPMSLTDFAVRLNNVTIRKVKIILKQFDLRQFGDNRQLFTVRLDTMPANMREAIERR